MCPLTRLVWHFPQYHFSRGIVGLGTYHSWGIISISARTIVRILSLKESIEGGSRSSGFRRAGAPVALTLRQPGAEQSGRRI